MFSRLFVFLNVALILAASLSASLAYSEDTPESKKVVSEKYLKDLGELLEMMGASSTGEQVAYAVANETLGAIAATGSQVTEEMQKIVLDEALIEFNALFGDPKVMSELYAPLYSEHLTEKEIGELLAFYKSPLGQKTLTALPQIGQAGAGLIQEKAFSRVPDFQMRVDQKLRAAGLITSP